MAPVVNKLGVPAAVSLSALVKYDVQQTLIRSLMITLSETVQQRQPLLWSQSQ